MSFTKTVLALGLVGLATAASAQTATIYGGGATLPARAYLGDGWYNAGNPTASPRQATPTATSLFGAVTAKAFGKNKAVNLYCQTGSGTGRNVLSGNGGARADGSCPTFAAAPTGFGAPVGQADPDFAASDAPLSATEFATAVTNKGSVHTQPVQFPAIAGAIAIVYNNAGVTGRLNLTKTQVCQIFKGTINNWNQLGYPAKPLSVVFRSDGSGTTFSFTNHLSKVCPSNGVTGYQTTSQWNGSAPAITPIVGTGASGTTGVITAVSNVDGAVGYGEVGDVLLRQGAGSAVNYATVAGFSPLNLTAPALTYVNDQFITGNSPAGRPVLGPAAGGTPKTGCIVIADPDSYADNANGYPIVAVSYLFAYNTGNRNKAATAALLKGPYTAGVKRATKTVGAGTGFAFLGKNLSRTVTGCVK